MIALLTKSKEVRNEIIKNCPQYDFCFYAYEDTAEEKDPVKWFAEQHRTSPCTVLFFDVSICIDTAPFRQLNPSLKCIALASPGNEAESDEAMKNGAIAILQKPLVAQEIAGVISLVSD